MLIEHNVTQGLIIRNYSAIFTGLITILLRSHDKNWRHRVYAVANRKVNFIVKKYEMRFIRNRVYNQFHGEFKFRFKFYEKKKYLYAE